MADQHVEQSGLPGHDRSDLPLDRRHPLRLRADRRHVGAEHRRQFLRGIFYAGLAESLPKTIRGSGFGTVYSVSIAAFGGTTQLVVTWLIHATGSAMAPAWYLVGATAIGQIALLLMRESAPVKLGALLKPARHSRV